MSGFPIDLRCPQVIEQEKLIAEQPLSPNAKRVLEYVERLPDEFPLKTLEQAFPELSFDELKELLNELRIHGLLFLIICEKNGPYGCMARYLD